MSKSIQLSLARYSIVHSEYHMKDAEKLYKTLIFHLIKQGKRKIWSLEEDNIVHFVVHPHQSSTD